MLFSICIPQYDRTSFLLRALESIREQTFNDFEICISDGGSTDGRAHELIAWLNRSKLNFQYQLQERRARYDQNLRGAIALAKGRYCLLLGNDDMFANAKTLEMLAGVLAANQYPEIAVTNYHSLSLRRDFLRVPRTTIVGSGAIIAAKTFRRYSFVSAVLLDRARSQEFATDKWDGSEMYQMFLATRIVAAGGRLLDVAQIAILKDIQIPGEVVDSYARKPKLQDCRIEERLLPLSQLGRVVFDALLPYIKPEASDRFVRLIFAQLILITYPPWLLEYRRIQSWRYAVGIGLGMRPKNLLAGIRVGRLTKWFLRSIYGFVTVIGLLCPIGLFEKLRPWLYAFAKRK